MSHRDNLAMGGALTGARCDTFTISRTSVNAVTFGSILGCGAYLAQKKKEQSLCSALES